MSGFYLSGARRRLARRTAVGGLRYTARNAALNRRMLANPAAKAMADIGSAVPSTSGAGGRDEFVAIECLR